MATKSSAKAPRSASVRSARADIVRQLIAGCLVRAITYSGATDAAVAKWLLVSPRTLFSWVHGERPVSVEKVLACPQIADAFRTELCIHDHGVGSVPYAIKKRRGSK